MLPVGDRLFGQSMMRRLRHLEFAQYWDRDRLNEARRASIHRLIEIAHSEVPYFREAMNQRGLTPSDISAPEDLCLLPISTKDSLSQGYPDRVSRSTGQKTYKAHTSGSTGRNFVVLEDAETAGWYRASFLLSLQWAGWCIGERHLQTGMSLNRSTDRRLKDFFLKCHYFSAYELSDFNLDQALDVLEQRAIQHLWGYPGSLSCLARRAREVGWNQDLQTVVSWGDKVFSSERKEIEEVFGCRLFDTYGCGEGIQVAAQCGGKVPYHVHSLDVIVEYVDEKGDPVAAGETGEILLTRLHPGPMPLIRYAVGDVGRAGSTPCDCGRAFDVMEDIDGRSADLVLTPDGNRLIIHFFTGIFEHYEEIQQFQIVQDEVDELLLKIVPGKEFSGETEARLVRDLEDHGLRGMNIRVNLVPGIPVGPAGKRRFVLSNVQ
jgi:phenylacetate-CoA ligase